MENKSRHINFNKFVEDRSIEISKFLTDLELDTKKKGHQAFPKSIRRRAMSHNRYRIPRRMRKNMQEDLAKAQSMQKLPRCRKHIRKRRLLIRAYKMRSQKNQWLSTHLWAAKRMRMVNYYGFKVAFTPNNKSFRSAYRYSQHSCTAIDLSYYYSLTLEATKEVKELPQYFKLKDETFPLCNKLHEGNIVLQGRTICPCQMIRHQEDGKTKVRIFFHPAAFEEVRKFQVKPQSEWKITLQQQQTDLYCLSGPQSLQILEEALKQYGLIAKQTQILSHFFGKENPAVYFSNTNQHALTNKPLIDAPIPQQKMLVKGYNSAANTSVRERMLTLFSSMKTSNHMKEEVDKSQIQFWKMFNEGQNKDLQKTIFKITLRSKYTHRRKTKISKEQKKKIIRQQKQERQSSSQIGRKKHKPKQESMKGQSQKQQSSYQAKLIYVDAPQKQQSTQIEAIHPVLVALGTHSVYVWASNDNSCRLWRILSKLNVKVIGKKQLNHFYLQKSQPKFPQDYPLTKSFETLMQEQKKYNFEKYLRMPLPKRPNYLELNSPHPFNTVKPLDPFLVEVQMVSRGHCSKLSYICELNRQDLDKITDKIQTGKVGIVRSEEGEGQRKKYKDIEQIQLDLKNISPSRKIIGSITSGGYRYSRSREGGIGFINQSSMSLNYLQQFGGYVLIRRPCSPHYYLAQIQRQLASQK